MTPEPSSGAEHRDAPLPTPWPRWGMPLLLASGLTIVTLLSIYQGNGLRYRTYPEAELAGIENIHSHEGQPVCQACHTGRGRELTEDPIELCSGCHAVHAPSHPVGVPQEETPDPPLPLGAGKLIVCHTCHDPHQVGRSESVLRLPFTPLCVACHKME